MFVSGSNSRHWKALVAVVLIGPAACTRSGFDTADDQGVPVNRIGDPDVTALDRATGLDTGTVAPDGTDSRDGGDRPLPVMVWHGRSAACATPRALVADGEGAHYVAGALSQAELQGCQDRPGLGRADAFVAKLTPAGSCSWVKRFGGSRVDTSRALAVDAGGGARADALFVIGEFQQSAEFGQERFVVADGRDTDVFIVKLSTDGTIRWARALPGSTTAVTDFVAGDVGVAHGKLYVTGRYVGAQTFGWGGPTDELPHAGWGDLFLTELELDGRYVKTHRAGGAGSDRGYALRSHPGGLYLAGNIRGTVDFDFSEQGKSEHHGSHDGFIIGLDDQQQLLWASVTDTGGWAPYKDLATDSAGALFAARADYSLKKASAVLTRLSPDDGSVAWERKLVPYTPGPGGFVENNHTPLLAIDAAGDIYTAGQFQGQLDFDPTEALDLRQARGEMAVYVSRYSAGGGYKATRTIDGGGQLQTFDLTAPEPGQAVVLLSFDQALEARSGTRYSAGCTDIALARVTF